jgi:enamine deaminase RidA (YjgF/YER057c/UK114 family)
MTDAEIDARLAELGLGLPEPAAPVAAYVPVVVAGGLAHVSGQLPFVDDVLVKGRLGADVSTGEGYEAARACGLMILAQLRKALGSLDRIEPSSSSALSSIRPRSSPTSPGSPTAPPS